MELGSIGEEDLDEVDGMRSPCKLEALATTYTLFFIYAQIHLDMENMS